MRSNDPTQLAAPPLTWRIASTTTIAVVGLLSKAFLNLANSTTVHGLDDFVRILDERKDPAKRERGLVTVSNHVSVVDDPVMWGVLPLRYMISPTNARWSLGSHDICFKNRVLSTFFTLGQTLPMHRLNHSQHGGLFQPTMTQAVRLLSRGPFTSPTPPHPSWPKPAPPPPSELNPLAPASPHDPLIPSPHSDPFTDPSTSAYTSLTYTTNQTDSFPAPAAFSQNRFAWLHIFPEGQIHQDPHHFMRYHKWGIARLVLESDPCPDVVPIYVAGNENVMHEERGFPTFLPRVGKKIEVRFGHRIDRAKLEPFRERWAKLREKASKDVGKRAVEVQDSDLLMHGPEAVKLRCEVARFFRQEVDKLRVQSGEPPEEDASLSTAEHWRKSKIKELESGS